MTDPTAEDQHHEQWEVVPKARQPQPGYERQVGSRRQKGNKIKTTKYSLITFLPKNLFEQFHRFANIYFLAIVILNWIPQVNAFGKEIAMFPLVFVLSVTAIKDLFEDRRRYKSDQQVNNSNCKVYSRILTICLLLVYFVSAAGCHCFDLEEICILKPLQKNYQSMWDKDGFVDKRWKDAEVGDIIQLASDDIVPADILLLRSSGEDGICFVSTASLDGETNLKQKQVVKLTDQDNLNSRFSPADVNCRIKCEMPNNQIHSFYGYVNHTDQDVWYVVVGSNNYHETDDGHRVPVDKSNLLLRGCLIRNTEFVEGIVVYAGHDTKAMLNNSGPRYKRSKLEKDVNKDVLACVGILLLFCTVGGIGCGLWSYKYQTLDRQISPDINRSPVVEGVIRFWTFVIILQVIIPISLYVSVELVKLVQVYFMNQDLEMYYEPTAHHPVCRATNINEDLGQIKYVFSDKTGTLTENKMVFKKFSVRGTKFIHPEDSDIQVQSNQCRELEAEIFRDIGADFHTHWREFFLGLAICNTVVVSENNRQSFKSISSGSPGSVGSADNYGYEDVLVNGDQIIRDDSDKHLQNCNSEKQINFSVQRSSSEEYQGSITRSNSLGTNNGNKESKTVSSPSLCMTQSKNPVLFGKQTSVSPMQFDMPKYEVESPDEGALVKAAALYGYKLTGRSPNSVTITLPSGQDLVYEILHILHFDSERKRMSVIVKKSTGEITLYCKGADSIVLNRLSHDQENVRQRCDSNIEGFARDGLRTLCVAKKDLSYEEYNNWARAHKEAELALVDRDDRIADSAELIETRLELLGATGIEDKLQDGVPETIAGLREAGIRVWVLTGDKQGTAINVAFACKLLDERMEIVVLNTRTKEELNESLDTALQRLSSRMPSYTFAPTADITEHPTAVVIDGTTLAFALERPLNRKFLDLTKHCQSVVCCRAAPLQKASVVRLVRENLRVMCLSIGDGANDVSMLQMADVGIGIAGNEGMQAVMASDFVLGRFKFLKTLLLVHGHWCYDRLSRMVVYFFYKNAMFVALLFWFQIFNGFSGSNAIDDFSLIFFNLIFTSVPPIVSGIWDQCTPSYELLSNPKLYNRGQESKAYTRKIFWIAILDALYQSLVLFFFPYLAYRDSAIGMVVMGILFHQIAVLTASLHLGIEIPNWTGIHHFFLWGSILLSYIWFLIFCVISPSSTMYWSIYEAAATAEFWLLCLLTPVVALTPRYLYRCFQWCLVPTEIQLSRMSAKFSKASSQQSLNNFHEHSSNGRNVLASPERQQQRC